MSRKTDEILNLLSSTKIPASDITKPLKSIGNGNMLQGIKNISRYMLAEGEKKGVIKGSIGTVLIGGILYIAVKGGTFVRKKISEKNAHKELGKKIQESLAEELTVPTQSKSEDEKITESNCELAETE